MACSSSSPSLCRWAALALVLLAVGAISVHGRSPVAFRLDDVQCGYLVPEQQAIISAFIRHSVPLTLGVINQGYAGSAPGCYYEWLEPMISAYSDDLIEVASHSFSHQDMTTVGLNLTLEVGEARTRLQAQFPTRSISLFIPPYNYWNLDTAQAMRAAGYTSMSPQCTTASMLNWPLVIDTDTQCVTNRYTDVQYPFYRRLESLYYLPVGCSTSTYGPIANLVNVTSLLNAPTSWCRTYGICSILSQLEANARRMTPEQIPFANVMMHPQDFLVGGYTPTQIGAYFDDLLTQAKAVYDIYTISNLLRLANSSSDYTSPSSSSGGASDVAGGSTGSISRYSTASEILASTGTAGVSGGTGTSGSTSGSISAAVPRASLSLVFAAAMAAATTVACALSLV